MAYLGHIGNKISLMNPLAMMGDPKSVLIGPEIARAVIALAKHEFIVKDKLLVAIMIERHRRRRNSQEQSRLVRLINQPMQSV